MDRFLSFLPAYFYSILACLYLFSIGWVFRKNRNLIHDMARRFRSPFIARTAIPEADLAEMGENIPSVILPAAERASAYNTSLFEFVALGTLIQRFSPKAIFEIGTFKGRTATYMALNSSPGTVIYTLDLPRGAEGRPGLKMERGDREFISGSGFEARSLNAEGRAKIKLLYGDSASFDFSPFNGAVDLVFVDGSHSYEYVLNDSKIALSLLRKAGGVIVWHDYGSWDGVTRALNELYASDPAFKGLRRIKDTSFACLVKGQGGKEEI